MAETDTVSSEAPVSTGSVGAPGADDMLAQLAGDEIDRLLAEADAEGSAASVGAASRDFAAPQDPPTDVAAVSMPPVEQTVGDASSGSHDLDTTIAAESAARLAEPAPTPDEPVRIAPEPQPPAPPVESPAEHAPITPTLASSSEDGPLPLYIRFLELLNSPLDAFPDSVREIIGKFGLATMANAIAMLVYVRFFRHK